MCGWRLASTRTMLIFSNLTSIRYAALGSWQAYLIEILVPWVLYSTLIQMQQQEQPTSIELL